MTILAAIPSISSAETATTFGAMNHTPEAATPTAPGTATQSLTRELYEGFQRNELHRWDAIFHPDVVVYSPPLQEPMVGLQALKDWGKVFLTALAPRIDLVDEYDGRDGRAFITVCLYWNHVAPFFHLAPTGTRNTSIETFLLRVENGLITEFRVADQSLDLVFYLNQQGMPMATNVQPSALVRGIEPGSRG